MNRMEGARLSRGEVVGKGVMQRQTAAPAEDLNYAL